jgi:hypothetical protein
MSQKKATKKPARKAGRFTAEERTAMKERVRELEGNSTGESTVLARIARMPDPDRSLGERLHAIIMRSAPGLVRRLWYGMPAYARDDKVVLFFQDAAKFKSRYATLGFSDKANLDEGRLWPTAFALRDLTAAEEAEISALVKKAVS